MLDSLKIYETLKTGGVPEDQARAMTQALQKAETELALDMKTVMEQQFALFRETFATKNDLANFATKADFAKFATKDDLAHCATKADFAQLEARLTRWMLGFWVSQFAVTLGVVFAAFKLFR